MKKRKCISCGSYIRKSGLKDPYLCRYCENDARTEETSNRYLYLDIRP